MSNVHEYFDYGIVTCPAPGIDVHIGDTMTVTRRSHHSEHSNNERTMERSHSSNLNIRSTKDTAELDKFVRVAWEWYIQDLAAARKNDRTRYLYVPVKRNSAASTDDDNNQVSWIGKNEPAYMYTCIAALAQPPRRVSHVAMALLLFRKAREKSDIRGTRCRKKRRSIRSLSPTKKDSSGRSTTFCNERESFPSRDFQTSWDCCCMGHPEQVRAQE